MQINTMQVIAFTYGNLGTYTTLVMITTYLRNRLVNFIKESIKSRDQIHCAKVHFMSGTVYLFYEVGQGQTIV